MEKFVKKLFAITIIFALVLSTSCGAKELSRNEAAQKIRQKVLDSELKNAKYVWGCVEAPTPGKDIYLLRIYGGQGDKQQVEELVKKGLVTVFRNNYDYGRTAIEFTEKARQHLNISKPGLNGVASVVVGEVDKIEITEIRKVSDNENRVSFIVKYKSTPSLFREVRANNDDLNIRGTTTFNPTDRGWQPGALQF